MKELIARALGLEENRADNTEESGHPIPINDVWIAAHTLEAGAILVTYDAHFTAVPGLRIWDGLSV